MRAYNEARVKQPSLPPGSHALKLSLHHQSKMSLNAVDAHKLERDLFQAAEQVIVWSESRSSCFSRKGAQKRDSNGSGRKGRKRTGVRWKVPLTSVDNSLQLEKKETSATKSNNFLTQEEAREALMLQRREKRSILTNVVNSSQKRNDNNEDDDLGSDMSISDSSGGSNTDGEEVADGNSKEGEGRTLEEDDEVHQLQEDHAAGQGFHSGLILLQKMARVCSSK